jgi:FixJ family two-component response regulator
MIFLIDDDKSVRRAFEMFLKSAGMEFRSYSSATEFISSSSPVSGDLLVLDLNLPGMSGLELLKKLDKGPIHMPVIVVTAFDDPASRKACRDYGVSAYLRKPVDGEALMDMIRYNTDSRLSKP